jgi:hypothetical protein
MQHEHDLHDGRAVAAALGRDRGDQALEGQLLMSQGLSGHARRLTEQFPERRIVIERHPQGQRIDEVADQRLDLAQIRQALAVPTTRSVSPV